MKFWVTCPHCKRKFGVDAMVVAKYLDRLFDQMAKFIEERRTEQK